MVPLPAIAFLCFKLASCIGPYFVMLLFKDFIYLSVFLEQERERVQARAEGQRGKESAQADSMPSTEPSTRLSPRPSDQDLS